jgi:hypothetical protein
VVAEGTNLKVSILYLTLTLLEFFNYSQTKEVAVCNLRSICEVFFKFSQAEPPKCWPKINKWRGLSLRVKSDIISNFFLENVETFERTAFDDDPSKANSDEESHILSSPSHPYAPTE